MHGSTLTVTDASLFRIELQHQGLEVEATRDAMAVWSMRTIDTVPILQILGYTNGRRFLPAIKMQHARQRRLGRLSGKHVLENSNRSHASVGLKQLLSI